MASARSDHSPRPSSSAPSSTQSPIPQPPAVLSNEDIEAVIKMATSTRPNAEGRPLPNRDTRTQLFIGNLPYRVRWQDLKDLFRKAGTVLRADVSLGPDNRSRGYGTVLLATAEDAGRAVDMFNGYSWQTRTLEVRLDRLPPELDYSTASNLNVVGMPSSSSMPTMPVMRNLGGVSGGLNNVFSAPSPLHGMPYIPPAPQAQPAPGPSSMLSLPPTAPSLNETFDTLYQGLGTYAPEPLHATAAKVPLRIVFVGNLPFHCQWQDLKDLFRQAGTVVRADVALGSDGRSRGFGTVMFATEADAERAVKNFNGFEYNGRALKVHFDKFAQMPQPSLLSTTMSASSSGSPQQPNAFSSQQQQNNMSGGYMPLALGQSLSLGAQYNYNQQQQRSPTLSTFEAYSFNQPTFAPSPRLSERHIASSHPSSSSNNTSRSNDNDNSNNAPTATTSSVVPHPPHPPLPLPLQGSSASTGVAGPAQEGNSNSPSSQRSHSHSHSGQNHPAHPGPISLPPPGSFVPMPHLSPSGLSPMHHPMSPLHIPGHPHVVAMTPHGLPPITPSMPPFSFLPQDSPQFQHHQHHQHQHPHQHHPQHPHQHQQGHGQHNTSSSTHPHSPTAGTPMMHPAHRMFAPFSPGMTMSPGAFWGRPGPGGHAGNPYLNPAVGSPVLMHAPPLSPGGMYGGHPGTPGMMGEEPTGYFPPIPSPHHLQQQQQQPSGYFPPVPVQMNAEPVPAPVPAQAQGHGQGHVAEALEKEIMRDTNNGSAASSTVDTTGSGLTDTGSSVAETTATRSSLATSWVSDEHVGVGISPAGKVVPGSVSTGDISSILSLSSEETGGSGTQQQHDQQQQSIQPPPRSQAMSAGANIPPHAPPALTHKTHSDQTGVHLRTRSATPSSSSTKPGWSSGWDGRADSHNNSSNNSHNHTTSSVSASATGSASAASTSTNPRPRLEYDWDIWGLNAPPGSSRLPPELDLDLDVAERLRRCRDRDWERSAAAHAHAAAAAGATSGDGSAPSGTPSTGTGAGATAPTATATLTDAFSEFRLDPDPISAAARRARWGLDLAGQQFQSQSSRGRQGESRTVSGGSGSGGGRGGSTSGGHGTPNARGVGLGLPNASSQCP